EERKMADLEDVTLDGRPLQSLRVADLKAALEERGLSKSGQKNALIKRLKGALMLENLQKTSTTHVGLQPNSQIGEEMSQNSFIKQYLAKQQELLRQRLEREAREAYETNGQGNRNQEADVSSPPASGSMAMRAPASEQRSERGSASSEVAGDSDDDDSEEDGDDDEDWGSSAPRRSLREPARVPAARSERALEQERLERERIEREKALEQERLEKERLEREKTLEQERLEKEIEQERLEKERIQREKAAELERIEREQASLERERMEKERAEKERKEQIEREKALELEKLERAQALEKEKALAQERALGQEQLEKQMVEEQKKKALHQEKERDANLLPPSGGSAPEQENAHAPVAQSESQPSDSGSTPLSPQSSSKKFRFLRDSPARPQSGSIVIKRPRTFSDTPQSRASPVTSPTSIGGQRPGGTLTSTNQEDAKIQSKQDVGAVSVGSTGTGSDGLNANRTAAHPGSREETSTAEATLPKTEESVEGKDERKDSSISEDKSGREAKKEEKKARRRSSSNDYSSSDSDSGSSSSRSSSSSSSSQDKAVSTSRMRQVSPTTSNLSFLEGKHERGSSLQAAESQSEDSKESPKASHPEKELPVARINTADGDVHTMNLFEINKIYILPFLNYQKQTDANRKRKHSEMEEEEEEQQRQEKEASTADPEKSSESKTPKAFSGRKISLGTGSKQSPGNTEAEHEPGAVAGRKRRWGSSTAVTAKKPSISITTESLKSLIPDIRPPVGQEAVVDLHPEEAALSGAEDEDRERSDQDLQIRRTVTQVVPVESQENGQKEAKRMRRDDFEEDDSQVEGESVAAHEEQMDTSLPATVEIHNIFPVTPSDTLIRRSISQQKTGVSITIDDPVRTARQPSPPRGQVSSIVHIWNLVRPFTLGQLKELLSRTGTLVEDGFWIDKIKSHCYVTYSSTEEAVATRAALHGVKWPQSNPKVLRVDFCQQDELRSWTTRKTPREQATSLEEERTREPPAPPPRDVDGRPRQKEQREAARAEEVKEREERQERKERTKAAGTSAGNRSEGEKDKNRERERDRDRDRDKVKEFGKPGEEREGGARRSQSIAEDPPAKLLDDLFRKTKAVPCIYWLPLTEEQFLQREAARAEEVKEREERQERKERTKAAGTSAGNRSEGEKDKNRERERDRDRGDKRRDGYRRSGGGGAGSSRRSRSRSEPRDRRR
uniref:SAP domain-containing protein n=1 Tax=Poecilia formosa TaxID=48698 RepID=A0A096MF07_POEFO